MHGRARWASVPHVEVRGLRKTFGERVVLDDVNLDIAPGEMVSVIGPSGGGKTTLFRCILGELRPDAGAILIDGKDVTKVPPEHRGVGIVYQSYALFPHLTVAENVSYGLRVRKVKGDELRRRTAAMLETVQLTAKADAYTDRLSGGERQRVALARALAVDPKVLLLDEAFTALDATTRSDVVQQVRELLRRLKVTTLLITHDQEEAFLLGSRVLVLGDGRVVTVDVPERIMRHPHPFVQEFVRMCVFHESKVETDERGRMFVATESGAEIPIRIPGVRAGDVVHIMVKKGPVGERTDVWRKDA